MGGNGFQGASSLVGAMPATALKNSTASTSMAEHGDGGAGVGSMTVTHSVLKNSTTTCLKVQNSPAIRANSKQDQRRSCGGGKSSYHY